MSRLATARSIRVSGLGADAVTVAATVAATVAMGALAAVVVAIGLTGCAACDDDAPRERPSYGRSLIILGVDGMDPRLLDRYMSEGRTPNLAALAARGAYQRLATTNPPQSPVAWSTFITGQGHAGHGIYDFVHRDPRRLAPYLSTSRTHGPGTVLRVGGLALPLSSGSVELLREGRAFWQVLEDAGVPATVVKIPANFPPAPSRLAESMSGMGTPDLLGTYGTFQVFTDEPALRDKKAAGGVVHALDFADGDVARARFEGPPNPLSPSGAPMRLGVDIVRDPDRPIALVRIGDAEVMLQPGEWSRWVPLGFDPGLLSGDVAGMVRLYLASVRPHLRLYASPINIDPADPAMPLSSPDRYARDVAADIGRYYTQGMPEDTKALAAGALTQDEFLAQADIVFTERLALLDRELDRFRGGALFFYFSSIDQVSHVFWRSIEPDAPAEDARYAHVIPDLYARIDQVVGDVLERVGPDTDVLVMSDHGFAPYQYKVHLNTWLAQQGYLSLLPPDRVQPGPLGHIDWDNTQAYALGLNQVFINLRDREARGAVTRDKYEVLLRRLSRQLEAMRDPRTGARVITAVERPEMGAFGDRAPDLLIGYSRGYRSSDESAIGGVGAVVIEPNRDQWSGDHCMHPSHVPGVVLATRPLAPGPPPSLLDLAPTILSYFDVAVPGEMRGRSLWPAEAAQ